MKKIIIIVLLMIPFWVNAKECDKAKHDNFVKLSSGITYDNNYSKASNSYTITIYNVLDEMYVEYDGKKYTPSSNNTIVISKILPGTRLSISIFGDDNCNPIKTLIVNEPYYNKYYGSDICKKYKGKLLMCSSQFTSVEVTKSLLEQSIYNYEHNINQKTDKDKNIEKEESFFGKVTTFMIEWGIKILLSVLSTISSIVLFSGKYRKIKHGI